MFQVISICRSQVNHCFSKVPFFKALCQDENIQIGFTLAFSVFLSFLTFMLRDRLAIKVSFVGIFLKLFYSCLESLTLLMTGLDVLTVSDFWGRGKEG